MTTLQHLLSIGTVSCISQVELRNLRRAAIKVFPVNLHVINVREVYLVDAATSSEILKAKQKLGRTFNSNKLGGIAFTKISKLTMCSAYHTD